MGQLVYDVAASLDGYIAGADGDVSAFPHAGDHVDAYLERLAGYATVVMGRHTYEFGYAHGLAPGRRAYPHMEHVVFSTSIALPEDSEVRVERDPSRWLDVIDELKRATRDTYLCGGGRLAGFLLANGRIDRLVVKLAPVVLGRGVRLFGDVGDAASMTPVSATHHGSGVTTLTYALPAPTRSSSG